MNKIFAIANAIAAELNREFADRFTAVVTPLPETALDELAGIKVSVVPKSLAPQQMTRSGRTDNYTVDIGIQAKLAGTPEAEIPTFVELTQRVLDFMWARPLPTVPTVFISAEIDPIYSTEHLRQFRVFTSVVSVTYRQ